MLASSRLVPIPIVCDTCDRHFMRSLHDVGWVNSVACPECGAPNQLESGPNARRVAAVQSAWLREYQRLHLAAQPQPADGA